MSWKVIEECPRYSVSDLGEVRNNRTGNILRQQIAKRGGYVEVGLWNGEKHLNRTVHGLVARAFLGPRPSGHQVRHLNGDATDPRLENLEYGTVSQNRLDSVRHGTHHQASRTHCPHGHEYTSENTVLSSKGGRMCRECQRRHKREHARRKRAAKSQ